jgi:hypothetical protein
MLEPPETIAVFTAGRQRTAMRTRGAATLGRLPEVAEISLDLLQQRLSAFLAGIDSLLSTSPTKVGMYELDTIQISAQIDGTGRIGFLGTGAEITGAAGLRFVLKRSGSSDT